MIKGFKVNECRCYKCRKMCLSAPCMPTPSQVLDFMKVEKIKEHLLFSVIYDPVRKMIYRAITQRGVPFTAGNVQTQACIFFNLKSGSCVMQESFKKKPLEGKLAHHNQNSDELRSKFMAEYWNPSNENVMEVLDLFNVFSEENIKFYLETESLMKESGLIQ